MMNTGTNSGKKPKTEHKRPEAGNGAGNDTMNTGMNTDELTRNKVKHTGTYTQKTNHKSETQLE